MKTSIIYILVIFLLTFSVSSCCGDKTIEIGEEDKLRFNENDMFIYKSNLNNYDTLFIEEIISKIEYINTSEGFCSSRLYEERINYNYNNYTEPFNKDSFMYLLQAYAKSGYDLEFSMHASSRHPDSQTGFCSIKRPSPGDYFISDSVYKETKLIVYDTLCYYDPYKFAYNKKYGIISYEYTTGEIYALHKYIPKTK